MLSAPHLILVFLVALLVFGPEKLPELARNLSKWMAEFRRYSGDFQETIQREMRQLEQDAIQHNRSKSPPQLAPASSSGPSEAGSLHEEENLHAATSDGVSPEEISYMEEDETAYPAEANEFASGDASGGEYEDYGYNEPYSDTELAGGYDAEWQQESSEAGSPEPLENAATAQEQPAAHSPDAVKSSAEEKPPATTGAEHPFNDHPSAA